MQKWDWLWSFTDVGWTEGRVQPLCEGWWNRSDISPELKREIPAGTESRGGIREEGENGERCDPSGATLFSHRQLLTHTLAHILGFSVGVPDDALMQRRMSARGIKISIGLLACVFVCGFCVCLCMCCVHMHVSLYVSIIFSVQVYLFEVFVFCTWPIQSNFKSVKG